jgi:hypothetical protein
VPQSALTYFNRAVSAVKVQSITAKGPFDTVEVRSHRSPPCIPFLFDGSAAVNVDSRILQRHTLGDSSDRVCRECAEHRPLSLTFRQNWTYASMINKDNKAIVITGSSSGLGRATAKLFASKGWKVIASMRDPKKEKESGNIAGVTLTALDVTDPREIESVAEQVMASGGVDVVFNNAGHGLAGPLEGLTNDQILRMVNTSMLAAIHTTTAFSPHFKEKRAGLFITTTSIGNS